MAVTEQLINGLHKACKCRYSVTAGGYIMGQIKCKLYTGILTRKINICIEQ